MDEPSRPAAAAESENDALRASGAENPKPQAIDSVAYHFQQFVRLHGGAGPAGEVAGLLAVGGLGALELRNIIRGQGGRQELWFLKNMLDLVLDYLGPIADQGPIPSDVTSAVEMLKLEFDIREGDFFAHRAVEVSAILGQQLDKILEDLQIDNVEDLYQVELQAAFDLSYDQYLQLVRPAFERALLSLQMAVAEAEAQGDATTLLRLTAKAKVLGPIARLALIQERSIGARY